MKEERLLRIHRIYSIVLSVVIVISGICFMTACGCIYYSGGKREQIYTTEVISLAFDKIAIFVYLCLAMVLISFVFEILAPLHFKKGKPDKPYVWILEHLYATRDWEDNASIVTFQTTRKRFTIIRSVLLTIGSAVFLIYALNGTHFDSTDINGSIIKAMIILCICMMVPFAFSIVAAYQRRKSMQLEIELLKTLPKASGKKAPAVSDCSRHKHLVQLVLLIVGLVFVVFGLATGGTADVLTKAINICTECIGLG